MLTRQHIKNGLYSEASKAFMASRWLGPSGLPFRSISEGPKVGGERKKRKAQEKGKYSKPICALTREKSKQLESYDIC